MREVFMMLYRSDELNEYLSDDDCREVFLGILKGSMDITKEFLEELCESYGLTLDEVLSKKEESCETC